MPPLYPNMPRESCDGPILKIIPVVEQFVHSKGGAVVSATTAQLLR